jgi:hypothetical protein
MKGILFWGRLHPSILLKFVVEICCWNCTLKFVVENSIWHLHYCRWVFIGSNCRLFLSLRRFDMAHAHEWSHDELAVRAGVVRAVAAEYPHILEHMTRAILNSGIRTARRAEKICTGVLMEVFPTGDGTEQPLLVSSPEIDETNPPRADSPPASASSPEITELDMRSLPQPDEASSSHHGPDPAQAIATPQAAPKQMPSAPKWTAKRRRLWIAHAPFANRISATATYRSAAA